jgi:hypothetical protein
VSGALGFGGGDRGVGCGEKCGEGREGSRSESGRVSAMIPGGGAVKQRPSSCGNSIVSK